MRYSKNKILHNKQDAYKRYLKSRGIDSIIQYNTSKLQHPSVENLQDFERRTHIWCYNGNWIFTANNCNCQRRVRIIQLSQSLVWLPDDVLKNCNWERCASENVSDRLLFVIAPIFIRTILDTSWSIK